MDNNIDMDIIWIFYAAHEKRNDLISKSICNIFFLLNI